MKRSIPWIAALATLAMHLLGNAHYGFFRDELYFIICGMHPDWGYVDQPPLVPLAAAGSQLFGHSLFLLRAVPALFAAASVYVTCLLVIELGGGAFAQILAAIVAALAPVLVSFGMKVSTDEMGLLLWPLTALLVLRIAHGADPRWWLASGACLGLSLESKYSAIFFGVALVAGLVLSAQRRLLWSRWFAAGAALSIAIALPNALWQAQHGFPMWELLEAGQHGKNVIVGPLAYLGQEVLIVNPFFAPMWIAGFVWLLFQPRARFLGYTYAIVIGLMIALHGKHYYPANVYPIVIAAGGVAIEDWTRKLAAVRVVTIGYAAVAGLALLPTTLPVLPRETMVAYEHELSHLLHVDRKALATEHQAPSTLSSDYADMNGWPELAQTVARVYDSLPPADRQRAAIFTQNYGEAAAIDFFGPALGLPNAISGHNQYWLWGPRGADGSIVIDVGGDCGATQALFRNAQLNVAHAGDPWAISYERDLPVSICRGLKEPIASLWPALRLYE